MITLKDFMEAIQYQVTDTDNYLWDCYGPHAHHMEYWNTEHSGSVIVNCVFDKKDQTVYEVQAWDDINDVEYRWIHPAYIEGVAGEALRRGVDFFQSIDDKKFIDIELPEDIMEKATAMVAGEEYDHRIMVQLDLDYDQEYMLMSLAHEADMSLNQFVDHILRLKIAELKGE
jgi:hypothetical protein